jgi:hypothetical protein
LHPCEGLRWVVIGPYARLVNDAADAADATDGKRIWFPKDEVWNFVRDFDNGQPVQPFEFELTI